jgi:serine protease AprX
LRLFLIILLFLFQRASAQEFKYLIHLKDKKNTGYSLSAPGEYLSDKSIQRRLKQSIGIDSTDLPITAAYIDSISALPSVRILNRSRWFNQVLISIPDTSYLQQVLQLSFVLGSEPVNNSLLKKTTGRISVNRQTAPSSRTASENTKSISAMPAPYDYGASFSQIHIHHGEFLHNLGFRGEAMTIAILDDGFNNYLSNPAFESLRNDHRILGTYDFVNLKTSVNEEDIHGADCFSIIAADMPGTLIGTAPAANYWLFKTEDITSESPVEEQNWVAAAEFADSAGVDLITTSLGYDYFDDSAYDLKYPERNGHTALISRAANLAVAKGMIVTASAGNSGFQVSEIKYVICPADGDSVYAVGSVDANGIIAGSSSWGPNASGQVKPDGVSVGSGTFIIAPDGTLSSGSGTSFSNPNLAGLITCLWQAFPEFNSHDILSAVRLSSDKYNSPDDRYGYGIPDFEKAYHILLNKKLEALNQLAGDDWIRIFPVPFHETFSIFLRPSVTGIASIELLEVSGKIIRTETISVETGQLQIVDLTISQALATGAYFVRYFDSQHSKTLKILKN